jgi:WD40 repeat protein
MSFSPDGSRLVYFAARYLVVWDARTWTLIAHPEFNGPEVVCISFSPEGKSFVTGDVEGALRLWTVDPPHDFALIGRHSARVKSVAFSPDGNEVASASDDQTVALWDVEGRRLKTVIGNHAAPVLSVAFSPDGKRVVCGTHDAKVRIYTRHETLWGRRVSWR